MWKKVTCGFDGYNETINFGTRVVAESDCAVYEANTLATIQAEKQNGLASTPTIYGVHYSDIGCCLNLDSTVIMFNESNTETLLISTFDYKVDVFQVIANGKFLFVGLNNGELQLFNVSTNKKLFTRSFEDLVENNENLVERAQKCFVAIEFQKKGDDLSVLIVTQRGKIFRISNLKLEELEKLDMSDDVSVDIISKNIFLEEIFTDFSFHQILTSVGFEINEVYSLLLATRKYICWLNFSGDHKKYSLKGQANIKISRMEINQNKSHCFCLTDTGMLLIISLDLFVPILIWNDLHVLDFTLFEGLGFEAKSNLLLLTHGEENNNIILMSLPDFQSKFKLKVQLVSQLIHRQNASEDILFVEGFGDNIVDSIRFKAVVECHPEFRLQRILRKGRFEEAERFAQTFNLNVELVYKAHVQYLMQRLQRSSKSGENLKKSFDQFMILLDKITDKEFVSVCCISAIPPDFPSINELLKYGHNCLSNMSKCQINKQSALIQNINSVSERLYTYQIIYKYVDFENWLNFMEVDLIEECRKHLKKGEIREFVVIWSRHEYEIKRKLNDSDVELLLVEIPTSLPVEDTILLLQHIGPTLLAVKPAIAQFILKWTIARIQELEIKEKNKWPEIGLFWAHEVLKILEEPLFEFRDHLLPNNQFNVNPPDNAMKTFIKNLEYMQILKNNFNVIITCNEFLELNIDDLVSLILFRTPEDRINNLLNDFLKNMMLEHDLSSDTVITKYIQDMMVNSTEWIEFDQALWEISVSVLVPCIQSIEEKLKCVLGILKVASLPWSNTINKLVDDSLKLNHELTNDIQQYLYFLPQELIYRKYGFKDGFLYNQTHADCFITHILFKDSDTALQDALTIAKTSNNLYQTIIMNLVEKGKYKEATNILSTLDPDVRDICERSLLICCYSYLRRNMMHKKQNYLEFLPIISSRKDYLHIKNLNSLQGSNKLKAYGKTSDIMVKLSKCKRLQEHTATIFNSLSKQQVTVEEVMKNINCYVYLLNVSCEEWIVSLATQTYLADIKLTCFLISKIEGLDSLCDESYNKVTTLLVSTLMHKSVPNINQMEDEVELIHRIATQSLIHCPSNYTITALDMLSWFGLLKNSNICEKNALYSPVSYSITTSTLYTAVQNMFRLYISFRKNSINSLDSCIIEDFDDTIKNNFTENLLHLCNHLLNEQQSLACISLLLSFYWDFISLGISIDADSINHILNQSISHILKKMIMFKNFNLPCALNFLNFLEDTQALLKISEIENSISFSIQRSNSISLLGLTYCKINHINNYYTRFFKKYTQCLWAKKLSAFGISYKEAFKNLKGNELRQLLLKFVNSSGVTLSLLKDFCLFVDVPFQEGLISYLQELLLSWDPVMEIKTNNSNKEEIVFKSTESLRKLCFEILSKINSESKPDVQNVLLTTWNKVNYYYYEVFSIIIELYEKLTNNIREEFNGYKILLTFLMSYRRVSEIQADEKENWYQINPCMQSLLPICNFRLPLILLIEGDPWKIIKPELTLKTYKTWFQIISVLRLDKNTLCSLTIHRLTCNQLSQLYSKEETSSWCLNPKNKTLLADIKECVGYITNLEMASASLYYVVNHLPPGADQVAAAEMCYFQAQKWATIEPSDKAQKGLAKVEKKFFTVSISHILHSYKLGQEKYLKLVLSHEELVRELYHDPSICNDRKLNKRPIPDINRAVDAIASLNRMDIFNLRLELLSDWLQTSKSNLDTSIEMNITTDLLLYQNSNSLSVKDENVIRACYLLESFDKMKASNYLCTFVFGDGNEPYRVEIKLKALKCLCLITNNELLEQVTGRGQADIIKYVETLWIEYELEKLDLILMSDTSELLSSLLKSSYPQALVVAAVICRGNNLYDSDHWDIILSRMVAFGMIDALRIVLPDLTPHRHFINSEVLKKAWNFIILMPLSQAVYPLGEETRKNVNRSLCMISKCPVLFEIDISEIKKHCQRLKIENLDFYF